MLLLPSKIELNLNEFVTVSTLLSGTAEQTFLLILFRHDGKLHQLEMPNNALQRTPLILRR